MSIAPRVIQATPNLGIKIKMQRVAVAPIAQVEQESIVPPGGCEIFGVGWISTAFDWWDYFSWEMDTEAEQWVISSGRVESKWIGTPPAEMIDNYPMLTDGFYCVDLQVNTYTTSNMHFGVLHGVSMSDVRWEAVWDFPSEEDPSVSELGSSFSTWGNIIRVERSGNYMEGEPGETLTATAFCGGEAAGTLILRLKEIGY